MRDISFCQAAPYVGRFMSTVCELDKKERLCWAYGLGFPSNYHVMNEPINRMILTKFSSRISRFVIGPVSRIFSFPRYYQYWSNIKIFDSFLADKVARDESRILMVHGLLIKTIRAAKRAGKKLVIECGNSEPTREHERIMNDYIRWDIHHKYIYGDSEFRDTILESLSLADYLITISNVSHNTYVDKGYGKKLTLIPLTGSSIGIMSTSENAGEKPKAFISTAFHNFIKGTQHLLLAWKSAGIDTVPLLIVGRLCEDMEEFIHQYGPFPNVRFLGYVPDLYSFYQSYDGVGVLMSLSEGAVRTTPEMMSFGFPMIVSPDATCDLVEDGKNGYVIDGYDEEGISKRLRWFADDWERVHALRAATLASVSQRTVEDYGREVAQFLMSIPCD